MKTEIRTLTTRYITALLTPTRYHASTRSTRTSSTLAFASPTGAALVSNDDAYAKELPFHKRHGHRITIHRIERLIAHGKPAEACRYILGRTNRQDLSKNLDKRAVVLRTFGALLKAGADADARALQLALLGDARAKDSNTPTGVYGLLLLCLSELTPVAQASKHKQADSRVRAHRRILRDVQPLLRDMSADELAHALSHLAHLPHAGAPLCLALAGAYAAIHGDSAVSRRLGIQVARIASGALAAKSEAGFRQTMGLFPGAGKLMRNDETSTSWAARASKALQRTSRLEQNLADARHARHLRALYEERAKGKGPLEPITFTFDELVRKDDEDMDVLELSEVQLDLIAEGARMSLLASTLLQRKESEEEDERPTPAERRTFRNIGARLASYSRADFEQMSEAELNDLIARQEQYMKMTSLFAVKSAREDAGDEVGAPDAEDTKEPDTPGRSPDSGVDACAVAEAVQGAGSPAELSGPDMTDNPTELQEDHDGFPSTADFFEAQLRAFAEQLDPDLSTANLDLNDLGQRLVDKAVATRQGIDSGVVDRSGLDRMVALIERYKELQVEAEALASQKAEDEAVPSLDEVVQHLHDASTPQSTDAAGLGDNLRSGVSTLAAATTFLAELARLGSLNPAHISAALATMTSRGIKPDARFFTVLITASIRAGDVARAHALYDAMLRSCYSDPHLIPTSVTYASLFKAAELPQPKRDASLDPRKLFLPQPGHPEDSGIRTPRVLFREMMDLHDRITRGMRSNRLGTPAPDLPPIAIVTRETVHIALRAFLITGDLSGALGVLHAFKELHMRPSHSTYHSIFRELVVHIRRDLARPRSLAGPASSRWSGRFIGVCEKGVRDIELMRRLYDIAIPEGPGNDPRKVPTFRMARGAQRVARGAQWTIDPLERLLEKAIYAGMEPQPGLEVLTREVAREEAERARREMVPPPYKPEHRMRRNMRVMRTWRSARLREKRRVAREDNDGAREESQEEGDWSF